MVKKKMEGEYKMNKGASMKQAGFKHSIMFLTGLLIILAGIMIIGMADISQAADITVGSSGADYTSIQDAVNASSNGDKIYVWNGTYTENVVVNKTVSVIGNGSASCHVQAKVNTSSVFQTSLNYVNISGFNITGANNASGGRGVYLISADYCNISNNILWENYYGIYLTSSNNNTLTNNKANNNTFGGIALPSSSDNNTITGNIANNNTYYGIFLQYSSNNQIINNTVRNNSWGIQLQHGSNNTLTFNTVKNNTFGIVLQTSSNNNLTNDTVSDNYHGIYLSQSSNNNTLINNTANSNNVHGISLSDSSYNNITSNILNSNHNDGIFLSYSSYNNITSNNASSNHRHGIDIWWQGNNTLINNAANNNTQNGIWLYSSSNNNTLINNTANSNNVHGISLYDSSYNNITSNTANNNSYGIYLDNSSDNLIYNNYFENTDNAYDNGTNHWNITKTPGTNILGGRSLGGNHYSNYTGEDRNGDGIGDTTYAIAGGNNVDYLPLSYGGIYVDDNATSGWYDQFHVHTIQEGVDNATSLYNKIYVWNGTYTENVTVDKTVSIIGNGSAVCTVQTNDANFNVFNVTVDYVNISGLNITGANNSSVNEPAGIHLYNVQNCNISQNLLFGNYYGIYLQSSNDSTIYDNDIIFNNQSGVYLDDSHNCNITSNNISNNFDKGIHLYSSSSNCNINNNNITHNGAEGIYMFDRTDNCTISSNKLNNNNEVGIYLAGGSLRHLNNCTILNNNITNNNNTGIKLWYSNNCSIIGNYVINDSCGINLWDTENNSLYNNYLNNTDNINDHNGVNTWNITKTLGTNIVNGPYLGGNYWSNYTGVDTDHDGLGDTNYTISSDNNDTHPLVVSPTVVSTNPSNGATGASRSAGIVITFSKSMNRTTVQGNLTFSPSRSYSWSNNNTTLIINPSSSLSYSTEYTVTIGWNATDEDGSVMLQNYSFSFTTESSSGSDNPIPPPVTYPPTADANGPYEGTVNSSITFDGSGSSDSDGTIESYSWDFGDGSSGSGVNPTHTYTMIDTYTVTLTVTDNDGLTDSDTSTVTVEAVPPEPPTADANGPHIGIINQDISLDGSGSSDSDGSIVSYTWLCGDGGTVNGVSPTHSYTTAGTFDITLTVTDTDGLTDNDTTTATIYDGESVDIPDGYVIDTDGDGTYDSYLNESSGTVTTMETDDDGKYKIDTNGDGEWDYTYNPKNGATTPYGPKEPDEGFPWIPVIVIIIIVVIIAIILVLFKMGYLYIDQKHKNKK